MFYDEASIYCLNEIIKSLVSASKDAKKYGELDDAIIKSCKEQAVSYIEKNFADIVDGEKAKEQLIKTRNALLCLSASVVPSFNAFVKHLDAKIGQMTEAERRAAHKKKGNKVYRHYCGCFDGIDRCDYYCIGDHQKKQRI